MKCVLRRIWDDGLAELIVVCFLVAILIGVYFLLRSAWLWFERTVGVETSQLCTALAWGGNHGCPDFCLGCAPGSVSGAGCA